MKNIAIVTAAGQSLRFKDIIPKQYTKVHNKTILGWTIEALQAAKGIDKIIVIIHKDHVAYYTEATKDFDLLPYVYGGNTRQQSVLKGLEAIKILSPDNILIHDAVRPNISIKLIAQVISALQKNKAVDIGLPITDSVKLKKRGASQIIDRDRLYLSQTPQGFFYKDILELHRRAAKDKKYFTDDISVFIEQNQKYLILMGEKENFKITTQEDLKVFANNKIINKMPRIGLGIDIHRFSEEDDGMVDIMLGGVKVRHEKRIIAHSDGDIILHAVADAIFGALALGDIGKIFPSSKKCLKNMDSKILLLYAGGQIKKQKAVVANIDITVVCEKPNISKYSHLMSEKIAELLLIRQSQVNIKATTSDGLGFVGRGEGIMVQSVCSILV